MLLIRVVTGQVEILLSRKAKDTNKDARRKKLSIYLLGISAANLRKKIIPLPRHSH